MANQAGIMSKSFSVLLGIAMAVESIVPLVAGDDLAAALRPVQEAFVAGEPIDMVFTVHNPSDTRVSGSDGPPSYQYGGEGGLQITLHPGSKRNPTGLPMRSLWFPRDPVTGNLTSPSIQTGITSVGPHETYSRRLFAQQFFGDLEPGTYDVTYSVDIPTRTVQSHGPRVKGEGSFRITVSSATEGALAQALARRVEAFKSTGSDAAIDGLLIVNSPVVIPYLLQVSSRGPYDEVVMAMQKFKGNRQATEFVLNRLRTGDPIEVLPALQVLQEWGYVLPANEVSLLLRHGRPEARMAAIGYVYRLPGRPHLAELRALTSDVDNNVADAAKRALIAASLVK